MKGILDKRLSMYGLPSRLYLHNTSLKPARQTRQTRLQPPSSLALLRFSVGLLLHFTPPNDDHRHAARQRRRLRHHGRHSRALAVGFSPLKRGRFAVCEDETPMWRVPVAPDRPLCPGGGPLNQHPADDDSPDADPEFAPHGRLSPASNRHGPSRWTGML